MNEKILENIRVTASALLPESVVIADNVYRPFDMGPFGKEGFSLVLFQPPNKMLGVNFGSEEPSDNDIETGVRKILDAFAK
jgi:hypothetical protein